LEQGCSNYSAEKSGTAVAGHQSQHEVNEEQKSADHRYVPQDEIVDAPAASLANMAATVAVGGLEVLELWAAALAEWEAQVE